MRSKYGKRIFRLWLWELHAGTECDECERLGGLRDLSSASRWLGQFKTSVITMFALRDQLARELSGSWWLDRASDDMVIEQAARLLCAGLWHVHASGTSSGRVATGAAPGKGGYAADGSADGVAAKANPAVRLSGTAADQKPAVKSTWIEIRLLDEDDQPVAGEAYEIKFPDGSMTAGTLSAKGNARHAGIVPGSCEVRFPNIEANEWKRV